MGIVEIGTALAVAQVWSAVEQYEAREAAGKASRRASAAQERQSAIEAQKARIAQQREARIRTAQVLASSTTVGAGSSGVAGATSSIGAQTASNVAGINVTQELSTAALQANQAASNSMGKAAEAAAIGNLAGTIFTGMGGFKTIFGEKIKPQSVSGV